MGIIKSAPKQNNSAIIEVNFLLENGNVFARQKICLFFSASKVFNKTAMTKISNNNASAGVSLVMKCRTEVPFMSSLLKYKKLATTPKSAIVF